MRLAWSPRMRLGLGEPSTSMLMRCLISPYTSSSSDKKAGWSTNKQKKEDAERRAARSTYDEPEKKSSWRAPELPEKNTAEWAPPGPGPGRPFPASVRGMHQRQIDSLASRSSKPARHRRRTRGHQHGLPQTSRDAILASDACPSRR